MQKVFALVLLVSMAAVFAGCEDDSVEGLAKGIQKRFGVAVTLKTSNDDRCMYLQLSKLEQDYEALTKVSKAVVKARASKLKGLVLNPTTVTQVVTGEVTELYYVTESCNNGCWYNRVADKAIEDSRKYDGPSPATQLEKGDVIALSTQAQRDESLVRDYYTKSVPIYDKSDSVNDRTFIEARQQGGIFLNREDATVAYNCGRVLGLADLVGGDGLANEDRSGH